MSTMLIEIYDELKEAGASEKARAAAASLTGRGDRCDRLGRAHRPAGPQAGQS